MTELSARFTVSERLHGSSVALVAQDRFIERYLRSALERHGAAVIALQGAVDELIDLLSAADPRPSAAVLSAEISPGSGLTDALARLHMPFVLISEGSAVPAAVQPPPVPLWQWPFGAFEVVAALAELIEASGSLHGARVNRESR